uniref:EXPERA domain-containing protein n=1 Tax=Plectus sambesii TaxID=2011161 RepID=A0A914XET3_9BILA
MYDIMLNITKLSTLLHSLISVPLYIACLTIVLRNRNTAPFNSPFFLIYIAHGLIDLANFFDYILGYKLPFWGYFPSLYEPLGQPNWFGKIIDFVDWSTGYIQSWIIVLVALNRVDIADMAALTSQMTPCCYVLDYIISGEVHGIMDGGVLSDFNTVSDHRLIRHFIRHTPTTTAPNQPRF